MSGGPFPLEKETTISVINMLHASKCTLCDVCLSQFALKEGRCKKVPSLADNKETARKETLFYPLHLTFTTIQCLSYDTVFILR